MDLQSIKLNFIQDFLKIEDEQVIANLVNVLKHGKKGRYNQNLEAMEMETFTNMIDQAEDDAKNERIKDARKLRKEIT